MEASFRRVSTVAVILSLIRPVGLLLGLGFEPVLGHSGRVISATLHSLLAGIFMHVTFFMLPETVFSFRRQNLSGSGYFGPENSGLGWRLAFTMAGGVGVVVVVALLQLLN